jgi:hypothetical protein
MHEIHQPTYVKKKYQPFMLFQNHGHYDYLHEPKGKQTTPHKKSSLLSFHKVVTVGFDDCLSVVINDGE